MIRDKENIFSTAQLVTTGTNTGLLSTDKVDLGAVRDIGAGENLYIVAQVSTALDMDLTQALIVQLVTDDNAGLNSPTVVQVLGQFAANAAAQSQIVARIQPSELFERYIGLRYIVSTGNALSAGNVTGFVTLDPDVQRAYANAFSIA